MMVLSWIALLWGAFSVAVTGYFTIRWLIEPPDPLHHELLMGAGMGLIMGLPAWLALLVFVAFRGSQLSVGRKKVLLAPVLCAAVLFVFIAIGGGL
jgi:hypothetical protein